MTEAEIQTIRAQLDVEMERERQRRRHELVCAALVGFTAKHGLNAFSNTGHYAEERKLADSIVAAANAVLAAEEGEGS